MGDTGGIFCQACTYLNDLQSATCAMCNSRLTMIQKGAAVVHPFDALAPAVKHDFQADPFTAPTSNGHFDHSKFVACPPERQTWTSNNAQNDSKPAATVFDDEGLAAQLQCAEFDEADDQLEASGGENDYDPVLEDPVPVWDLKRGMEKLSRSSMGGRPGESEDDIALAAQLQREELGIFHDAAVAAKLQERHDAEQIDPEQRNYMTAQRKVEEEAMLSSSSGRAWKIVEQVLQMAESSECFGALAIDEMVDLTERFIDKQNEFAAQGKSTHVTIAYHNTKAHNLASIQQSGLMSPQDMQIDGSIYHRSGFFGDGIYTANNAEAFTAYGERGLMVAILKGITNRVAPSGMHAGIDTGVGNKMERNWADLSLFPLYDDETVLRTASQCLPLISYATSVVKDKSGTSCLWKCHVALQILLDDFFNNGIRTPTKRVKRWERLQCSLPPAARTQRQTVPPRTAAPPLSLPPNVQDMSTIQETLTYNAPETLSGIGSSQTNNVYEVLTYQQASALHVDEECYVCLTKFACGQHQLDKKAAPEVVVKLVKCHHMYHLSCLTAALKHSTKCAVCRADVVEPRGPSPSGTMTITWSSQPCDGFESISVGTFVLEYKVHAGIQASYHETPGRPIRPSARRAFVPCTGEEAWNLMKRLTWAWMHGMTFSVGTSMTSGQHSCVIWASIHHKTARSGGGHGFPDPNYFFNCNGAMDALGVPAATLLNGLCF